jgi:formate--tetrahydrofolate ligase
VRASDLKAHGAMTVLLKDALKPNLVQTLENNPAFVHGGPFANIAHGCNSVVATSSALKLADYVITEAGFGADLGAEKFVDIKCRKSGLRPDATVLVATIRALKYHGGVDKTELAQENVAAVEKGFANLERHLRNLRDTFGLPCVVAINRFTADTDAEVAMLQKLMAPTGVPISLATHWAEGGRGAEDLARKIVSVIDAGGGTFSFTYEDGLPLWDKMKAIASKIYGASDISADASVRAQIARLQTDYGHYPVCVAKTQYSFTTDASLRGAPSEHVVNIREVRLAAGAEFVVMICGDIMTMPGLPKVPAAERIDLGEDGKVVGLF